MAMGDRTIRSMAERVHGVSNESMAAKLRALDYVETVSLRIKSRIRRVDTDRVCVRSERTDNDRVITFESIRNWSKGRGNGRVRLALAVALGLTNNSA